MITIDQEAIANEASALAGTTLNAYSQQGHGYYLAVLATDAKGRKFAIATVTECDGRDWATRILGIVRERTAGKGLKWDYATGAVTRGGGIQIA